MSIPRLSSPRALADSMLVAAILLAPALAGPTRVDALDPRIGASLSPAVPSPSPTSPGSPTPTSFVAPTGMPSPAPTPSPTPTASPTPIPTPPSPLPVLSAWGALAPTTTLYGRGYGHGVGMSQYGAFGRAQSGQSAAAILGHYYPGTTIGSIDPQTSVRVLVLSGFAATAVSPLVLYGRGGSWTIDGVAATFPADAKLAVVPVRVATSTGSVTSWRITVTSLVGTALVSTTRCCDLRVRPAQASTRIQVWSKPSTYDTYRGWLRIIGATTQSVINTVPLDMYLRGVVPAEMPWDWPSPALAAQAIASRSYAARRLHPSTGSYDLYDDTRSQVYRGVKRETAATSNAIDATSGQVLLSSGVIANTLYHSTGGGATESNRYAFPTASGTLLASQVPYLTGSADRAPDGRPYDSASPYARWQTAAYTPTALSAIFAGDSRTSVGTIGRIDILGRGVSGRVYAIRLTGSAGVRTVSGDVFVAVFDAHRPAADPWLPSTLFDVAPIG
jgi:SpoIID/LytB domain protein